MSTPSSSPAKAIQLAITAKATMLTTLMPSSNANRVEMAFQLVSAHQGRLA